MTWNGGREISVAEVQELASQLGIPHFQRGLVWGPDSISALLESLFYQTPCGSFVFWKTAEKTANGTHLLGNETKDISYFVVDGQQRIRSLYSVEQNEAVWESESADDASEPEQSDSPKAAKVWCINLTRVKGFRDILRPHGKEYSMFLFAVDPTKADKRSPIRTNILPLHQIEHHSSWDDLKYYHACMSWKTDRSVADAELAKQYLALRERVLGMKQESFFVSTIETNHVADVVALYNRINSGGKRVETEERAFAKLVALQPSTWPSLAETFAAVHQPDESSKAVRTVHRDDVLKRGRERSFGFKLFIRVFLQVCHHHFGYSLGKSTFSFDIAKKESFLHRLRDLTDAQAKSLWDETQEVLTLVSNLLRSPLCCDDFRFLPDTQNLMLVFQLLISYPRLRETKFHPIMATLILRLFLAQINGKTLAHAVADAADPDKNAFDVIPPLIEVADRQIGKELARGLEGASSIQDRYVLLLYWLVRRNGARDFSYLNVPESRCPTHSEVPIDAKAKPEKQHMVPFSRLVKALNDKDAQRGGTHPFNNIGNLTYISREMNSFETGLGDIMAPLLKEPIANRRAHLLWEDGADSVSAAAYRELLSTLADSDTPANEGKVYRAFNRFCEDRRARIGEAFRNWLDDMDRSACETLGLKSLAQLSGLAKAKDRVEPQRPKFVDTMRLPTSHIIRGLDLDNDVESVLIRLGSRGRKGFQFKSGVLRILLTKGSAVCLHASTDRLVLTMDNRMAPEHRAFISNFLGCVSPDSPLVGEGRVQLEAIEKLPALADVLVEMEEKICAGIDARKGGKIKRLRESGSQNRKWTEDEFLASVDAKDGTGKSTRKLVEDLLKFGRSFETGSDPFRSRSKEGSAIFGIGEIGLFTLYPEDLYIRVLRNIKKPGAPSSEAEWDVVIQNLNSCGLGTFGRRDLGHARIVEKRLKGITEDDVVRFKSFVSWFADSVKSRTAGL